MKDTKMTKTWLKCKGFEDSYEVSTDGEIRSVDRYITRSDTGTCVFIKGKILKFQIDKRGYCRVSLHKNNEKTTAKVHRIVAETFIPNPDNKPQVNHIDGVKTNNSVSNLEWMTNKENIIHSIDTGIRTYECGKNANAFTGTVFVYNSNGELIYELNGNADMKSKGFDFRLVSACLCGKRKTHKGCTFVKNGV